MKKFIQEKHKWFFLIGLFLNVLAVPAYSRPSDDDDDDLEMESERLITDFGAPDKYLRKIQKTGVRVEHCNGKECKITTSSKLFSGQSVAFYDGETCAWKGVGKSKGIGHVVTLTSARKAIVRGDHAVVQAKNAEPSLDCGYSHPGSF